MDERVNKYFTTKNIIFGIMIVLFLIFLGNIADIALMAFAAYVISATLNPIIDKLEKYMPRVVAVSLILLFGLGIILLILIPLISLTIKQGVLFIENLPNLIKHIQSSLHNMKLFGMNLSSFIGLDSKVYNLSSSYTGDILNQGINITKIIANSITTIIATSIMVFYICYDRTLMKNGFIALFPEKFKEKAGTILDTITTKVGGYVFAQLLAMIFVGVITALGLIFLGHEHAILLGFLTCILDIIPVVGPTIAVATGLLVSLKYGFWFVIITFIIFISAQLLQNQLLRPLVFGKFMNMHPLTVIMSLLIGAKFLGFWGIILGPAIASVVVVLIDELYIKPINQETVDEHKE